METGGFRFTIVSPFKPPPLQKQKGEVVIPMKLTQYLFLTGLMLAALTAGLWAQTDDASRQAREKNQAAAPTATTQPAFSATDFQALKDGLAAAQQQIQKLQDELHRRDQAVQQAQTTADDAAAKA